MARTMNTGTEFGLFNPDHPEESCENCGHSSDCATHSEPAYPAGPCSCGASTRSKRRYVGLVGLFPQGPISTTCSTAAGDTSEEGLAWVRNNSLAYIERNPLGPWEKLQIVETVEVTAINIPEKD